MLCTIIWWLIIERKKQRDCAGCSVIAIFQDDNYSNNYLLVLGNNSTRKPSNDCSLDQSHIEPWWKHMGICYRGLVWHPLLLNILQSFHSSLSFAPKIHNSENITLHLSTHIPASLLCLLRHILSFVYWCYLKKKKEKKERTHQRGMVR